MDHPPDQPPQVEPVAPGLLGRLLRDLPPRPQPGEEGSLDYWRRRIIWVLYLAAAPVGTLLFLAVAPPLWRQEHLALLALDSLTVAWCWLALFLHRHLSARLRALAACLLTYGIGTLVLLKVGPISGGLSWLFAFAVLAGILLGRRAAALAIGLNAATLALISWAWGAGRLNWPPLPPEATQHWQVAGINFILLGTMVAAGVAAVVKGLESALTREQEARRALHDSAQEARQATAHLDSILRASPVGIGVVIDRMLTMANPRLCQITGYAEEELLGRSARMLYPTQDDYDYVGREKYRQISEQGTGTVETRWQRKDGAIRHILLSSTPMDAQNLAAGVTFTALDITDRKKAEQDLKESRERFRALGEQSPLGVALLDGEGGYQYLNPAFTKMFGYALEDIPHGRRWFDLAFPDPLLRRRVIEDWQGDMLKPWSGETRSRTYAVACKDGSRKTILFRSMGMGPAGNFVIYEDIGDRLAAEAALKAGERRYRELFDGIDDIVFTHDLDGRVTSINRAVLRALGFSPEEIVGRDLGAMTPPMFRHLFRAEYLPAIRSQGQVNGVTKYLGKDGGVRYLEYRCLLTREEGEEACVRGSARDVTDRVAAERELRRLEEQLFQSQKMEAVGVLAGGIAHDFNNVLQAIAGYVQLLHLEPGASVQTRQRLDGINGYIERAAGMIKRLMTMARKADIRLERVELNQEIRHMVGILEHTLPKMIAIRLDLDPDLGPISGDPGQIEQVLLNLATNAGQAMPGGGELTFLTAKRHISPEEAQTLPGLRPGPHVMLVVSDTGLGMDEETRSHVFEPFFTTKPLGEGTGLGLSTAYGIVANHGGLITCQSRPGQGAAFTIFLPRRADDAPAPAPVREESAPRLTGSERILVVDDEQAIRETSAAGLRIRGYAARAAASGEEALEIFRADPDGLDLVIMDLGMPGMGGLSSLLAMREIRPEVRILVATGYADAAVQEQLGGLPRLGIIQKPYRLAELLARARELLES